jgi:hypothetical protein
LIFSILRNYNYYKILVDVSIIFIINFRQGERPLIIKDKFEGTSFFFKTLPYMLSANREEGKREVRFCSRQHILMEVKAKIIRRNGIVKLKK